MIVRITKLVDRFLRCAWALILLGVVQGQTVVAAKSPLSIHTNFPGGSALVESIDQTNRVIRLKPFPHEDRGWACWWYFKLTGVEPGETITVDVEGMSFALPNQAMFSKDNKIWQHTENGKVAQLRASYRQKIDQDSVWFCWGPPFQLADARALVEKSAKAGAFVKEMVLCKSVEGREVPALRIEDGDATSASRRNIWISARQHAWESGSSWVCRGLVEWLISQDPRAVALRQQANFLIVPIMDVDNVERGAGGKNEKPQDHNRDWSDQPHFPEVRAAIKHISELEAKKQFDLFVDLHNPAPRDHTLMFFLPPKEIMKPGQRTNLERFLEGAKLDMTGPLKPERIVYTGIEYDAANWERISGNWVVRHTSDHAIALCLETAWNTPHSTTDGYLRVGRELGLAIERYFQKDNRTANP